MLSNNVVIVMTNPSNMAAVDDAAWVESTAMKPPLTTAPQTQ